MNKKEILNKIEQVMEMDEGSLTGTEKLMDLQNWDSLAVMGFIAMVDNNFGTTISNDRITACETINDLCALVGDGNDALK